jgi:SCY1-like protein 1
VKELTQTDSMIFVATERVMPLSWDTKRGVLNVDVLRWGLYTVSVHLLKRVNIDDNKIPS